MPNGETQPQFDPESELDGELPESDEELALLPLSKDEELVGVESDAEWLGPGSAEWRCVG